MIFFSGKNDGQFYRTLPVEARKTLHDQTKSLTSASKTNQKEGNEFVLDFVQKRTVGDMEDISANFKKVLNSPYLCHLHF